ncbi:MAG: hypothetical protein ABEJ31_12105 [Haloarculaceae archaeon]
MRRETVVILLLIAATLGPLWYFAMAGEGGVSLGTGAEPVEVVRSAHPFAPTAGFVDGPVEVSTTQSGVITWVALLLLTGVFVAVFQFLDRLGRRHEGARADGRPVTVPTYLVKHGRQVLEYVPASGASIGLTSLAASTVLTVLGTIFLVAEGVTLARTQYIAVDLAIVLLSLTLSLVLYTAYFVPHVTVVEPREHAIEGDS